MFPGVSCRKASDHLSSRKAQGRWILGVFGRIDRAGAGVFANWTNFVSWAATAERILRALDPRYDLREIAPLSAATGTACGT